MSDLDPHIGPNRPAEARDQALAGASANPSVAGRAHSQGVDDHLPLNLSIPERLWK